MEWSIVAGVLLVLLALYVSWTAGRLDRMHARVDASRAVLDAEHLRRSGVALEIATSGLLDPATSVLLADAASRARTADDATRDQAVSDLTDVLVAVFGDPADVEALWVEVSLREPVNELTTACRRAAHARRFHNSIVRSTQRLRRKLVVRWLGLSGRAPWPETVELDDTVPAGLEER